jgi:hypothetical protein
MKKLLTIPALLAALFAGGAARIVQDQCGPFTDVTPGFCPYILELYYLGITAGTSATTFSPDDTLTRGQGAVFIAKGLNQSLARSSRRAALGQWWTVRNDQSPGIDLLDLAGVTPVGSGPSFVAADGSDVWVTNNQSGTVSRVRASDGRVLETWTGADSAYSVLVAMGRVFVTGNSDPGALYMIDPSQPAGAVTVVATNFAALPLGLAFDGSRLWSGNGDGTVSIFTPGASLPWSVQTIPGFSYPASLAFDGANIWVSDYAGGEDDLGQLDELDGSGNIVRSLRTGIGPQWMTFDGSSLWVPSLTGSVAVVRTSDAQIIGTVTVPRAFATAFDGRRVAIVSSDVSAGVGGVFFFDAATLSPIGSVSSSRAPTAVPRGICSDGINFWIAMVDLGELLRL